MILADELTKFVTLDRYELRNILAHSGYTGMSFESAKFVGLTNGGEFCYSVTFFDDNREGETSGKVYVKKGAVGDMIADF